MNNLGSCAQDFGCNVHLRAVYDMNDTKLQALHSRCNEEFGALDDMNNSRS